MYTKMFCKLAKRCRAGEAWRGRKCFICSCKSTPYRPLFMSVLVYVQRCVICTRRPSYMILVVVFH